MNSINLAVKQTLLGGSIGALLMRTRNLFEIVRTAYKKPEHVGTIANDQIASFLLTRLCQHGKAFIDVGSHIGSVIAEVMRNDKSVKIIAIEADPEKAECLKLKFKNAEIHGCAAGNETGEISFFINEKQSGYSSLIKSAGTKEIRVPIKRLDDIIANDNIDVIKIDVEGAELGVVLGAKELISKCRPIIMFESAMAVGDMWEFFNEMGYSIHIPARVAHNDDGLDKHGYIESHVYPRRTTNYFAIPGERRIEIRNKARVLLGINS